MKNEELIVVIQQSGELSKEISTGKILVPLLELGKIHILDSKGDSLFFKDLVEIASEIVQKERKGDMKILIISSEIIYGEIPINSLVAKRLAFELKEKFSGVKIKWAIFDYYPILDKYQPNIDYLIERTFEDPNITLIREIEKIW